MQELIQFPECHYIGISVRTTNTKASTDLGQLWNRFFQEGVIARIPNKTSDEIFSIYTEYESDHRGAYTTLLGCKVTTLENIPLGMHGHTIKAGAYKKYLAVGKIPDAIVSTWQNIWQQDALLKRKYTSDFEVYGTKAQDPNDAEVEIYIAV